MSSPRVHLAGDPDHGFSNTHDMRGIAHATVQLRYTGRYAHPYAELLIDCEVYKAPDGMLSVHSICPKCSKAVMIRGDQKKISLEGGSPTGGQVRLYAGEAGGKEHTLNCPWELEGDRRMQFGLGLCGFRCVYENNVVREV